MAHGPITQLPRFFRAVARSGVWLASALLPLGCADRGNEYVPPPPPEVTVAQPVKRQVTQYWEYTGTTSGVETVEVRARVTGFLEQMHFVPGEAVEVGDLLFTIDQRPFRADVAQAEADLKGKQAAANIADVQFRKAEQLLARQASTELEVDEWKAKRDQAAADAAYAAAALERAKLDLGYTEVRSPIPGVVSENRVDIGTLVGASEPTLLTTVIRQDQVYAYFDVSEREVLLMASDRAAVGLARRERGAISIEMGLANERGYPHRGVVDFADNTVNPDTGTLRVRAVFDNPEGALLPGLFVRLRVPRLRVEAVLVPDAAVGQDQAGRFVLVVKENHEVERRTVTVGKAIGAVRPIETGLTGDEWIIINGMLRTRPGGTVKPKQTALPQDILPRTGDAPAAPATAPVSTPPASE